MLVTDEAIHYVHQIFSITSEDFTLCNINHTNKTWRQNKETEHVKSTFKVHEERKIKKDVRKNAFKIFQGKKKREK